MSNAVPDFAELIEPGMHERPCCAGREDMFEVRLPDQSVVAGACEKNPETERQFRHHLSCRGGWAAGEPSRRRKIAVSLHIRPVDVWKQPGSGFRICPMPIARDDDTVERAVVQVSQSDFQMREVVQQCGIEFCVPLVQGERPRAITTCHPSVGAEPFGAEPFLDPHIR
ncbi:hypothetical protein ACQGAO_00110 [Rhodococcus sp. 1.20]